MTKAKKAAEVEKAAEVMLDEITATQALEDLKKAHYRLLRQHDELKKSKSEMSAVVYQAVADAHMALELPKIPAPPKIKKTKKHEEVAVAVLSDLQLGKVTPDYNSQVCEERIELYAQKVIELTDIQRADHPVNECRVWVLGDIIEGVDIFPGQSWLVDSSLYRQMVVDGPRIMINFLRTLLTTFDTIHVTAIIGNHGRIGRRGQFDPESNGDRILYRVVQQLMENEPRITWHIPDGMGERNWYAVDRIGNYSCMLFHGDQIRGGFAGFPFYGLAKKVWGWKSGAIPEQFDDVMFGHWHQNVLVTLNKTIARCSGSPESFNTYAQENLAAMGRPSQRLMYVDPKKGCVTGEYLVWLD